MYVITFCVRAIIKILIVTGNDPEIWKHSLVDPHHKSGDINDSSNFRSVSILTVLSKAMEKIAESQLKPS